MLDLIIKISIVYAIGYVIAFIIMYYRNIRDLSYFTGTPKELIKPFFLSFVWPAFFLYFVIITILKWLSLYVLTAYVYIKEFFLNIFGKNKKLSQNVIEEEEEPQKEINEEEE